MAKTYWWWSLHCRSKARRRCKSSHSTCHTFIVLLGKVLTSSTFTINSTKSRLPSSSYYFLALTWGYSPFLKNERGIQSHRSVRIQFSSVFFSKSGSASYIQQFLRLRIEHHPSLTWCRLPVQISTISSGLLPCNVYLFYHVVVVFAGLYLAGHYRFAFVEISQHITGDIIGACRQCGDVGWQIYTKLLTAKTWHPIGNFYFN